MMKILLLGANGQVGTELQRALRPLGHVSAHTRTTADLMQPEALAALVQQEQPDVIVNAAAHTAVDKAETDREAAQRINTDSVAVLAAEAKKLGAWLVHYSTDYVFDGSKPTPYTEGDATAPLNVYGATKQAGEQAIIHSGCNYLIFRTSWVYALHGNNFIKTVLRLASTRDEVNIVSDQFGAPTGADLIADVTALCLYRIATDKAFAAKASGLYHLTAQGETTWHGFAQFILQTAAATGHSYKVAASAIGAIPTSEFPTPAKRPHRSIMNGDKLQKTFGLTLPDWQAGVQRVVNQLCPPV